MWKNQAIILTKVLYICIYNFLSKTMAEAKTVIQENHQSKLSSQVTLIPFGIFIDNERLLTYGYSVKYRSSRPDVFCKEGVLRNFTKFKGKHLCQSLFFNKVADLRPATLLKKRLWHRCFPVNFVKFVRTLFLQNTSGGCFQTNIRQINEIKSKATNIPYSLENYTSTNT